MQETKLADSEAPELPFRMAGYELVHHGEGRWNGVAIASKVGATDVVTNFGDGPVRDSSAGARSRSARTTSTRSTRPAWCPRCAAGSASSASTRRTAASSAARSTPASSTGSSGFGAGSTRRATPDEPLILGGDLNATPTDEDVWDAVAAHGGTHVSEPERAALASLRDWGLVDAYRQAVPDGAGRFSWWDYRAGMFHRNEGMRIDLLYVTKPVADRIVWAEIDREARKGPPIPSDHAPVVVDLDERGLAVRGRLGGRAVPDQGPDAAAADQEPRLSVSSLLRAPRRGGRRSRGRSSSRSWRSSC